MKSVFRMFSLDLVLGLRDLSFTSRTCTAPLVGSAGGSSVAFPDVAANGGAAAASTVVLESDLFLRVAPPAMVEVDDVR